MKLIHLRKRCFHNLLLITLTGTSIAASAHTLAPGTALQRVYPSQKLMSNSRSERPAWRLIKEFKANNEPMMYAIKYNSDILILSAQSTSQPLVAVIENADGDLADMPPAMEAMLSNKAEEIEKSIDYPNIISEKKLCGKNGGSSPRGAYEEVKPLLGDLAWGQDAPYNACIPFSYPTGCTATALAQVLKYYSCLYPGPKSPMTCFNITVIDPSGQRKYYTKQLKDPIFLFSHAQWASMQNTYPPQGGEGADQVARLMQACGYAIRETYTKNGSSGFSERVLEALKGCFSYKAAIKYRKDFADDKAWIDTLYNELINKRPVLYTCCSTQKTPRYPQGYAHEIVIDGFKIVKPRDGSPCPMFHANWGWNGAYKDVYFAINKVTVGGDNYDDVSASKAIIGIEPDEDLIPKPYFQQTMSAIGDGYGHSASSNIVPSSNSAQEKRYPQGLFYKNTHGNAYIPMQRLN